MMRLSELFDVSYGHKLDLNKMHLASRQEGGINFVGRSSQNQGVTATVSPLKINRPYEAGLITVALGGTKLLCSFVQEAPFYTAQNVAVLRPRREMTFSEKVYLCLCIRQNRFRYSAFGREANRTLSDLLVPSPSEFPDLPEFSYQSLKGMSAPINTGDAPLLGNPSQWKKFCFRELFDIERGRGPRKQELGTLGMVPFITATDSNNGLSGFTQMNPCHPGNTIGVNRNGSVGEAFYQPVPFCSTEDVHVFIPKFAMNALVGLFLVTLIRRERYRFGYGRKWGIGRMKESQIRLPIRSDGEPDWDFVEQFMSSLPYSSQLR